MEVGSIVSPFLQVICLMLPLGLPSVTSQVSVTELPSVGFQGVVWVTAVLGGSESFI